MAKQTILVVDDDLALQRLLILYLKSIGFLAVGAATVAEATRILAESDIYAIVLDLELEDTEGYDLLRLDVAEHRPVIVISSRQGAGDRVESLTLGADDYLIKPVDLKELGLRLRRSIHWREKSKLESPAKLEIPLDQELSLNIPDRAIVGKKGIRIALSKNEFRLLQKFLGAPGQVIRREEIALDLMGRRYVGTSRAIDVLVSDVRGKLQEARAALMLQSVRGEGYRLVVKAAAKKRV